MSGYVSSDKYYAVNQGKAAAKPAVRRESSSTVVGRNNAAIRKIYVDDKDGVYSATVEMIGLVNSGTPVLLISSKDDIRKDLITSVDLAFGRRAIKSERRGLVRVVDEKDILDPGTAARSDGKPRAEERTEMVKNPDPSQPDMPAMPAKCDYYSVFGDG